MKIARAIFVITTYMLITNAMSAGYAYSRAKRMEEITIKYDNRAKNIRMCKTKQCVDKVRNGEMD